MQKRKSLHDVGAAAQPEVIDVGPLQQIAVSDMGFVFDPVSGSTFELNATGLVAVRALKGGASSADIAESLRSEYACESVDEPLHDVEDFLAQLTALHLIHRATAG